MTHIAGSDASQGQATKLWAEAKNPCEAKQCSDKLSLCRWKAFCLSRQEGRDEGKASVALRGPNG